MNLRSWLRRTPLPASMCVADLEVAVPEGKTKWADLTQTIESMAKRGDKIEAYDEEGTLLRAFVWDEGEVRIAVAPALAVANEDARMVEIARLLAEASDRGAERHAQAYQTAFATMENLVNLVSNRLVAMETAWQRAMVATAEAQAAAVAAQQQDGSNSMMEVMLPMIMGKVLPGGMAPPNGTTNGKAKE